MLVLENKNARVVIDPQAGGRISSLAIDGLELLRPRADDPILWGCYPMAPWAGRVRNGEFEFAGNRYQLPLLLPPHAIHGTVFLREWQIESPQKISTELGPDWPFRGRAVQSFSLAENALTLQLEVQAEEDAFPCSIGWHPWFMRRLARGAPAELIFDASQMYVRDDAGIAIGKTVVPPPGPWDDCFTGVIKSPLLRWPGALELSLHSNTSHWVVFNECEDAICVEPQTAPPDALNIAPLLVTSQQPLRAEFTIEWRVLSALSPHEI